MYLLCYVDDIAFLCGFDHLENRVVTLPQTCRGDFHSDDVKIGGTSIQFAVRVCQSTRPEASFDKSYMSKSDSHGDIYVSFFLLSVLFRTVLLFLLGAGSDSYRR